MWAFFLADAILILTAALIANESGRPLPPNAIIGIVVCVVVGAIVAVIPLVARYEREKNEALDERQRALESLSHTVATSAEQVSIAANGLHSIVELAQRNLKAAEQLPHKLQEKIAEFKAELDNANAEEREELEKELATLREGESEKLEATADKVTKAIAELIKLDGTLQKHVASATDAMSKASAAIEQAAAKSQATVAANLDRKLAEAAADFDSRLTALRKAVTPSAATTAAPAKPVQPEKPAPSSRPDAEPASAPAAAITPVAQAVVTATAPGNTTATAVAPSPVAVKAIVIDEANASAPTVTTVAPVPARATTPATSSPILAVTTVENGEKPERKRAPRKPRAEPSSQSAAPVEADDFNQVAPDENASAVAADGATRLIVTAYIGIGNRLFIRGEGPGLNWDKGVPLQFVSIGKWRWETADATSPVKFKLYKNDELECAAIGTKMLDPGHQQEVTATF